MNIDFRRFPIGCAVSPRYRIVRCPVCEQAGELRPRRVRPSRVVHAGTVEPYRSKVTKRWRRRFIIGAHCVLDRRQSDAALLAEAGAL